jgi:hypothetical protein
MSGPQPTQAVDPMVENILTLAKVAGSEQANFNAYLKEIPMKAPLAEARAVMVRHGFTCWPDVTDDRGTCLYCTAYKNTSRALADRVIVRLYYDRGLVVNANVSVERGVRHVDPQFTPPAPGGLELLRMCLPA